MSKQEFFNEMMKSVHVAGFRDVFRLYEEQVLLQWISDVFPEELESWRKKYGISMRRFMR